MKPGFINSAWLGSPWEGKPGLQKTREIGVETVDILADPKANVPVSTPAPVSVRP